MELAAARRRIRELETELAVTRRAFELLKEQTDEEPSNRVSSKEARRDEGGEPLQEDGRAQLAGTTASGPDPQTRGLPR